MPKYIKRLLLPLLISILFLTGCDQEKKCGDFRTGNFYHPLEGNDTAFIQRDDSSQIETKPGRIMKARVRWMNECEYELRMLSLLENGQVVSVPDSVKDMRVSVKIIETTKAYYVFEANRTDGLVFSDTLWIGRKVIGGFKAIGGVFGQQ